MLIKRWQWWPTRNIYVALKLADDLWYDTKANGERRVHLISLGWYSSPKWSEARLYTFAILWLSLQLGIALKAKK